MSNFDINGFLSDLHKKNFWKNLGLFLYGILVASFAFNLFFQRYNVVAGGSTGLSILLSNFITMDVSLILFILNLICLIIGLIFFGWEYAIKMLAITFIYPTFVKLTLFLTNLIDL